MTDTLLNNFSLLSSELSNLISTIVSIQKKPYEITIDKELHITICGTTIHIKVSKTEILEWCHEIQKLPEHSPYARLALLGDWCLVVNEDNVWQMNRSDCTIIVDQDKIRQIAVDLITRLA